MCDDPLSFLHDEYAWPEKPWDYIEPPFSFGLDDLFTPSDSSSVSSLEDPAALIAERVRQNAGVMLALPIVAPSPHTAPPPATAAPKLPIPRLPRQPPNSAASTPPPSTPSSLPSPPARPPPRAKTSHTTIERRYRTNLNARIQSLRMAVPALRVVDDRDATKKRAPNKVLVSADPPRSSTMGEDVVDDRGFVDGVKVARKCSKANVLAKAVEYIRVLKKREARLRNEQAGLKSLIAGLVGGPALLREWEREWRDMFGGEEKDEVDADADAEDDDSEDEDEEEGARKRKRGKTAPTQVEKKEKKAPDGTVPEKRKRGRPRKVVPPEQAPAPQQYLLAAFALFSFFNSPLTSSSTVHVHTGTVLNGSTVADNTGPLSYWLHLSHLLLSIIILLSCVSSWAGITLHKPSTFPALKNTGRDKRTPADWVRIGESYVYSSTPRALARVQAYHNITSQPRVSPSDLCTAALVLYGCATGTPVACLARARARAAWRRCVGAGVGAEYERLVLEMGVDEAAARLGRCDADQDTKTPTPMRVLGTALVRERMRAHLGGLFVGVVCGRAEPADAEAEGGDWRRTVEAARELGGAVGVLARRMEGVCTGERVGGLEAGEEDEDEVGALVDALVLYRRVFGGGGSSSMEEGDVGRLRRVLGCRVFEACVALEDARDRAVDRVVQLERWTVGLV